MTSPRHNGLRDPSARVRVLAAAAVAVVVGVASGLAALSWRFSLLAGWLAGAAVFVGWMWITIWWMTSEQTRGHAAREDPGQATSDVVILGAAVASLGAVALILGGGGASGTAKDVTAALSVLSVALAWATVHTVFTTRYARLYYSRPVGGIGFNEEADPRYRDFAYLSFTVGMTFQVSDTAISRQAIRDTVLRHMLLSYLLGAIVIATTINLVAGLAK